MSHLGLFKIMKFIYLFQQYLDRGAQFSKAGLNGALFNINLHTNNILQNTKFQITKVLKVLTQRWYHLNNLRQMN